MSATQGPRLRLGTETKEPLSGGTALLRAAAVVFVLTNPVAAIVTVATLSGLRRWRQVRVWWVLLAGVATLLATLLWLTMGPAYVLWALELGPVVFDAAVTSGPAGIPAAAATIVAARWQVWLLGQLPVGIALGLTVGASLALYARQHDAAWRRPTQHRERISREAAIRRSKRMKGWAQTGPKKSRTRAVATVTRGRVGSREAPVTTLDDVKVRFGVDQENKRPADVALSTFLQMCWIDGATGFGKTTDIVALVRGALEAPAAQPLRIPLVYINLKPDAEVTEAMRRIAHRAGRRFVHVSLDGTQTYNPIRHGTAAAAATRILEVEDASVDGGFTEPHHKSNGQELLGYATRALDELVAAGRTYERGGRRLPWKRDLHHLHRIMRMKTLIGVRHHLSADLQLDLAEYGEEIDESDDKRKSAEGMRNRISKMINSGIGPLLAEDEEGLNFEESLLAGDVVVMDLDSMQDIVGATSLANLAIKDLQAVLGHLGGRGWHKTGEKVTRMALVIVDEFSALGGRAVVSLLQRGRGNGAAVALATQDVGSVIETSQGLLTTILTNTNVQIVHVQSERAEEYAESWGTQAAMAETMQVFEDRTMLGTLTSKSGQGSLREVRQFVIQPDDLRQLGPGEVILATRFPWQQRRVLVQRRMPEPLTSDELEAGEPADADSTQAQEPQGVEEPPTAEEASPTTDPPPEDSPAPVAAGPSEEPDPWAGDDFDLFDQDTKEN